MTLVDDDEAGSRVREFTSDAGDCRTVPSAVIGQAGGHDHRDAVVGANAEACGDLGGLDETLVAGKGSVEATKASEGAVDDEIGAVASTLHGIDCFIELGEGHCVTGCCAGVCDDLTRNAADQGDQTVELVGHCSGVTDHDAAFKSLIEVLGLLHHFFCKNVDVGATACPHLPSDLAASGEGLVAERGLRVGAGGLGHAVGVSHPHARCSHRGSSTTVDDRCGTGARLAVHRAESTELADRKLLDDLVREVLNKNGTSTRHIDRTLKCLTTGRVEGCPSCVRSHFRPPSRRIRRGC